MQILFQLVKKLSNKNFFLNIFYRYSFSCPNKKYLFTSCEKLLVANYYS